MRNGRIHKLNMQNYVASMNRMNEKDHVVLIKAMEGITSTSYKGRSKNTAPKEPVGNTIGEMGLMEISEEGINAIN